MTENNELLTPRETAKVLRVSPSTLAIWRCRKRYPLPYVKVGTKVVYRRTDVEAFLEANLQQGSITPRSK
jgi:excisionase family DNA binding protein